MLGAGDSHPQGDGGAQFAYSVINSSTKGWGGGGTVQAWEGPDSAWWIKIREGILVEGNADVKKNRESTQQTWG